MTIILCNLFRSHHETTFSSTLPPVSEFSSPQTRCARGSKKRSLSSSESESAQPLAVSLTSLSPPKKPSGKALIIHTDGANIFFRLLIAVAENLTRYGCKLEATTTRRRTKNRFNIDCCTVECSKHCTIVLAQNSFRFWMILRKWKTDLRSTLPVAHICKGVK